MKNRYRVFVLVIGFSLAIALTITTIEHAGADLYDKLQRLAGEEFQLQKSSAPGWRGFGVPFTADGS